jgi:hypothetical protein
MALRLSTGLRNALVGGSDSFKDLLNNGWMDIYTGAQPANADAIETGTKLVRISSTSGVGASDGLKFGTAAAGVLPLTTPAWQGVVTPAGQAGWFRFYGSSGTGGLVGTSGTAIRFDGAVGISGADLNLSHTSLAALSTLTITAFNVTQPAE